MHINFELTPTNLSQCQIWTWYLAVDWQMSVIAPLFIYALYKYQWKFASLMVTLILAVTAYRIYVFDAINITIKDFFDM